MNSAGCYRLKKISKVAKLERLGSEASKDIIPKRHKKVQVWKVQSIAHNLSISPMNGYDS